MKVTVGMPWNGLAPGTCRPTLNLMYTTFSFNFWLPTIFDLAQKGLAVVNKMTKDRLDNSLLDYLILHIVF